MKMKSTKMLCGCALIVFAVAGSLAQTKSTDSGSCSKPNGQSIPAGDQQNHIFMIAQGTCTTKGEIGGAMSKEGAYSEHDDVKGNKIRAWGVYTETFDSGDKVFYNYQISAVTKDGALQSGKGTYQVAGGTSKMKGIKGKGTCDYTSGADGGSNYSCAGEYTLAADAMVPK